MLKVIRQVHDTVMKVELTGLDIVTEVFAEYYQHTISQDLQNPDERYAMIPGLDKTTLQTLFYKIYTGLTKNEKQESKNNTDQSDGDNVSSKYLCNSL
jgi:hypothetical protein